MLDQTTDNGRSHLERGFDRVVAARTVEQLHETVDVDSFPGDGLVDFDQLPNPLGRPLSRVVTHYVVDDSGLSGLTTQVLGGTLTPDVFADTSSVTRTPVELDKRSVLGPSLQRTLSGGNGDGD